MLSSLAAASALFALSSLVVLASGPSAATPPAATQDRVPYEVRGDDFHGVVLHPKHYRSFGLVKADGSPIEGGRMVERRMVDGLEAGLETFLKSNARAREAKLHERIATYKRQYVGLETRAGKRYVYANFLCRVRGERWKTQPVQVDDGGDCYLQLFFEPASGRYVELMINGDA